MAKNVLLTSLLNIILYNKNTNTSNLSYFLLIFIVSHNDLSIRPLTSHEIVPSYFFLSNNNLQTGCCGFTFLVFFFSVSSALIDYLSSIPHLMLTEQH
jgi:hypothetical protein